MAIAAAVKAFDVTRRKKTVTLALTFSGSYTTGGDTLNLTTITNPNFLGAVGISTIPDAWDVRFKNSAGGYDFDFVPGTTLANCKIKIWSASTTELTAAAYNAALTADTLYLEITRPTWKG